MNKNLQAQLDEFIASFLEEPSVKQYLLLKRDLADDEELASLNRSLTKAKKELALSFGTNDYEDKKKRYLEIKEKVDNHPLTLNYEVMKEEVEYLLQELKNTLL